tara:strand:+ start:12671 stop:13744 length:1074 start_codon:yes stop_codon:yes gene_type:complete
MQRFGGQLRWIEKRQRWRLDWCGKFQGSFRTKEEAKAKLETLKIAREAALQEEKIANFGDVVLRACTRCGVRKPENAFKTIVIKSTGETRACQYCIECHTKERAFRLSSVQLEKKKAKRNTPEGKTAIKVQNQKPEGKRKRALLQQLPESKKRRKEKPPPSATREKAREYTARHRKTPGYIERTTSVQFRLRQSLQAKIRAALKGRLHGDDVTKLGNVCQWADDADDLVEHFRLRLAAGMTMKNYGVFWSIAHVIPCAYYNVLDLEDLRRCNSRENLGCDYVVPEGDKLTNSQKGVKLPDDEKMIAQGASTWPKSWKGVLPCASKRMELEKLAHAGKLYPRKHVGQMDIRMFVRAQK